MSATAAPEITVVDEPGRQRFEIRVDGEVAGFTEYRRSRGVIAFIHTLIDPRFEGQGLGTRLVTDALSEVRPGMRIGWTPTVEDGARLVATWAEPGDLVLTIGAGDVDRAAPLILEALR